MPAPRGPPRDAAQSGCAGRQNATRAPGCKIVDDPPPRRGTSPGQRGRETKAEGIRESRASSRCESTTAAVTQTTTRHQHIQSRVVTQIRLENRTAHFWGLQV